MAKFIALTFATIIASVLATPFSQPKGASSNTSPNGNMKPRQQINRRCFGDFAGCGGCGFDGFGGCGGCGGCGFDGFGGCGGCGGCGFDGFGGCGGCGFGPVFSENTCCVDEDCFHESCFDSNTEAAVFCNNEFCNEVDANCFNAFNQDSFFIC